MSQTLIPGFTLCLCGSLRQAVRVASRREASTLFRNSCVSPNVVTFIFYLLRSRSKSSMTFCKYHSSDIPGW
jgi:hypothetical protein